jgi:hypothetical protein
MSNIIKKKKKQNVLADIKYHNNITSSYNATLIEYKTNKNARHNNTSMIVHHILKTALQYY